MLLKSYVVNVARFFGRFLPSRLVSTFFGIGYLPSWQNSWASLLSLVISYSIYYIIHGLSYFFYNVQVTGLLISLFFFKLSIIILLLSTFLIFIFQATNPDANSNDVIVVHIALAQIMIVALAMPPIIDLYYKISDIYNGICKNIFICPLWVNNFVYILTFFFLPFLFFNIINTIKPWPISYLQLSYNNCFSIMLEGFIYVLYTITIMYLFAFILGDLTILQVVTFNKYLFTFGNLN